MSEVTLRYRRTKTADSVLPDVLVDYLDLLLQDATAEAATSSALTSHTALPVVSPNPSFDATFDVATDCLQLLRTEIEASQQFVMAASSPWTQTFSCLRAKLGPYSLLVPLEQIRRVERVEKFNRFAGVCLPGLKATSYLLVIDPDLPGIYIDGVNGIAPIEPHDVLWRRPSERSPWFIGTHRSLLSRIFDPIYFLQQTRIGWRK